MLTDLDKLYIALAEVNADHLFNKFCYSFNIKSLNALKDYKSIAKGNILVNPYHIHSVKEKVAKENLDFKVLTDEVSNMKVIFTSQDARIHCSAHKAYVLVQAK